jgi:hypothetical protein
VFIGEPVGCRRRSTRDNRVRDGIDLGLQYRVDGNIDLVL